MKQIGVKIEYDEDSSFNEDIDESNNNKPKILRARIMLGLNFKDHFINENEPLDSSYDDQIDRRIRILAWVIYKLEITALSFENNSMLNDKNINTLIESIKFANQTLNKSYILDDLVKLSIDCDELDNPEDSKNLLKKAWGFSIYKYALDKIIYVFKNLLFVLNKITYVECPYRDSIQNEPIDILKANFILCKPVVGGLKLNTLDLQKIEIYTDEFRLVKKIMSSIEIRSLNINVTSTLKDEDYSLFSNLEALGGYNYIDIPCMKELLSKISNIQELKLKKVAELTADIGVEFSNCPNLRKLSLGGFSQPSDAIEAILQNLPSSMIQLKFKMKKLSLKACNEFRRFIGLKILTLKIYYQESNYIENLFEIISSSIIELNLNITWRLQLDVLDNLEGFKFLRKLRLYKNPQESKFIKKLITLIGTSIEVLILPAYILDSSVGLEFKICKNLRELELNVFPQESDFVKNLLPNIPLIRSLKISVNTLDDIIGLKFKNCEYLTEIELKGSNQESGFVKNLIQNIPLIRSLKIPVNTLDDIIGLEFQNCKDLKTLELNGRRSFQNLRFIQNLIQSIPSIENLIISIDQLGIEEIAKSLAKLKQLKTLVIYTEFLPENF